ncbi:hypothetical protein O9G_005613 [Rozella allomycis CSF55]|uniref:Uncharacterized protein n=1 Tax=Rozella allomycis (strain CSF55) TaxID=988480 RepID=A0A075B3H1_ROZAC|nr:hypothetical protein O9G_005613 [Rozella allomycis CSF55]|eukprot:EPZ36921.1 hypothetical protein O9G_005613 [Rozella allomycis CSF55]
MMLPREFVIENNNMDTFINTVFPDLHQNFSNTEYNSDVDFINHKIGESIHGWLLCKLPNRNRRRKSF